MAEKPESDISERVNRRLRILVTGKTGVGKSALVNSIVGENWAKEGLSLDPQTREVREYKNTRDIDHGTTKDVVEVTIFDSPGLQDCTENRVAYLEDMKKKCEEVDLNLYCINMNNHNMSADDSNAILTLSNAFGMDNFWKNTLFVLTFANKFGQHDRPPNESLPELIDAFKELLKAWTENLHQELIRIGISEEVAKGVPVIPAGYHADQYPSLLDREYWLSPLWWQCLSRTSDSRFAKLSLLEINWKRLREPHGEDDGNQEEYGPIFFIESAKPVLHTLYEGCKEVAEWIGNRLQWLVSSSISDDMPSPENGHGKGPCLL